jgi:hypothetical protein
VSVLKQRVPIVYQASDGRYLITLEWLKDLRTEIAAGGGSSSTDLTAVIADIEAVEVDLVALTRRVEKLEKGYHS